MNLIRRLSIKCDYGYDFSLLPKVMTDREPGMWGYPGCRWFAFWWLGVGIHVAVYRSPCEHCLLWGDK